MSSSSHDVTSDQELNALEQAHSISSVHGAPIDSRECAVSVTGLSKCYQIYSRPSDRLKQSILPRIDRMLGYVPRNYFREFWALRDVNIQIRKGDTVGIIGRNGSGKSTLLQLISGTLTPTNGDIRVAGKIAALLELGAGFNPEFTGRENVYMNAAVFGLDSSAVDERYDDIARFADIGDFIDQPVKLYSSGMYVRLAFAVIAHVDADILIVDEALSVGDAVFQQKCMRFLRAFRARGTLIFVSHDSASVINLCQGAIWLDHGNVRMQGAAQDVANAYLEYTSQEVYGELVQIESLRGDHQTQSRQAVVDPTTSVKIFENIANSDGWKSDAAEILSVELVKVDGTDMGVFVGGERVVLFVKALCHKALSSPILGFFVKDRLGQSLFGEHTYTYQPSLVTREGDLIKASFTFDLPLLPNGDYSMTVSIAEGDPWTNVQHHWVHDAVLINVASPVLRYGLVGIPFHSVHMSIEQGSQT